MSVIKNVLYSVVNKVHRYAVEDSVYVTVYIYQAECYAYIIVKK